MKKIVKNLFIILIAMAVFVGYLPVDTVDAATAKKIKLNKTSVTVYAGKTVQLKITGTSKKVTWKSGNKAVATVYKGKVTTKKAGTATITAKVGKKNYKCKVTVKKPYLNKVSASVYVGKTVKLKLTGATVKSYTSKNKAVATVTKKGVVTAKKKGTAKIVVKDTKGRTYNCSVTVKKPYLNQTNVTIGVGDSTTLKLKGATAANWTSSDVNIVNVSAQGVITGLRSGAAVVTCTDSKGRTYTAKVTASCYNHTAVEAVTKEVKCTDFGITKHSCMTCDYSYNQIIPALGHDYLYHNTVSPSKEGPGCDVYLCSRCSDTEERNVVEYSPTAEQVYQDMIAMKSTYPEGMPWTNDNFYAWKAGYYSGGYGCAGFAFMLSDAAFGYLPATMHDDFDEIKPGDILRINNDGHSVVVIDIQGDTYTLAEGSFNDSVHWGRTTTLEEIKATGTYAMTRYPQ